MDEVMPDSIVEKIKYKLVDVSKQNIPNDKLFAGSQWAKPDEEHLMFLMRQVYKKHFEALKKAKAGRKYLIDNLSWDKAAGEIIKAYPKKFELSKDRTSKQLDNPHIWMLCPTLGGQCGIATYTEALIEPLKKKINVSDKEGDILHIQFQYGLYQIQSLQ